MSDTLKHVSQALFDIPIDALELSTRSNNALKRYFSDNQASVGQVIELLRSGEIDKVPNLGLVSAREVRQALGGITYFTDVGAQGLDRKILDWAHQHIDLVKALMRGQAVIVPTTYVK